MAPADISVGTLAKAAAVVALLQAIFVLAYVAPGHDVTPHGLPVAVVGSSPRAAQVAAQLTAADFHVLKAGDRQAARDLILNRKAYGAFLLDRSDPAVLIAPAASMAASQVVTGVADEAKIAPSQVESVVPLTSKDPRGVAFNLLALPLLVTSILGAQITLSLLGSGMPLLTRLLSISVIAAIAGLLTAAIVGPWFGVIPGDYLAHAGVLALAIGGLLLITEGLIRLLGLAGLGAAFAFFLIVANPASGVTSAPELVPGPWQQLGAVLAPGNVISALRSTAYFDGAGLAKPILTLVAALLAGLILEIVADHRQREGSARSTSAASSRDAGLA